MNVPGSRPKAAPFAFGAGLLAASLFLMPRLAMVVPPLALPFTIIGFLAALPLIAVRIRGRFFNAFLASLLAFVIIYAADSLTGAVSFLLLFAGWAIFAGEVMARRHSVIAGCGAGLAVFAAEALAIVTLEGSEAVKAALTTAQAQASFDQWATQAALGKEEAAATIERVRSGIVALYPSLSVVSAASIVALNAVAIGRVIDTLKPRGFQRHELLGLRWPIAVVVAFVVSGGLLLVPDLQNTGWNGLVVTMFLFLLQGLSVFTYGLSRLFSGDLIRALLVMSSLLGPWAVLHSLVGLFDQWFDFRARLVAEPPPDPNA
jgi:hypothetical protein